MHLFFWSDGPTHVLPPHLGVGLSHTRYLLWCPAPQGFELQSDQMDQVDQPPFTKLKYNEEKLSKLTKY